ncbi:glycosyltransferase family 2 protein [Pseudosulfitobacter pseudonitzschiae]|nr:MULTISPECIES: glycosyltransferase family 2 protein [Roseobacteraceae]
MMQTVAVVTMVRDDAFFLKAWLRHYGEMFGRQNCYVVNHGYGEEVAELAKGCNIIGIPGDPHKNFDVKRWSLLNNLFGGLRRYYKHVIVGDVDELVVVDPDAGVNLLQWLEKAETDRIYTPVGLEVIHRIDLEDEPAEAQILGPRRHVRIAPHYSKPCIVSTPAKLSRGGHFAQYPKLHTPDDLYLMHLKFCDFGAYTGAMDRRNAVSAEVGVDYKQASIGRHWFAQARGEDREVFDAFAELPMQDGFDMRVVRRKMHRSFKARGDTGYFEFDRPNYKGQYVLPERFSGIF